jgi:hypothetical protein
MRQNIFLRRAVISDDEANEPTMTKTNNSAFHRFVGPQLRVSCNEANEPSVSKAITMPPSTCLLDLKCEFHSIVLFNAFLIVRSNETTNSCNLTCAGKVKHK